MMLIHLTNYSVEQHGKVDKSDLQNADLVGSIEGYRKDDEPVDVPKSPSRSTESRSNSLTNSSDSNQNERLTETPATETDLSRDTPPPKPNLSIETNQNNPQLNISPSSPIPRTAPANNLEMQQTSPPRNNMPKSPSIASMDEKRSTKNSFSFGSRRKESIQIDRKNSTESKKKSKDHSSGLDGLGIRGLKFWSSSKHNSTSQNPHQRQREPSITMPVGVVKTASGGPGRLANNSVASGTASLRSVSPTQSNHEHGNSNSATTSMIEHFPDSRYPNNLEMGDGKREF